MSFCVRDLSGALFLSSPFSAAKPRREKIKKSGNGSPTVSSQNRVDFVKSLVT
jgi:hypothetical protein